MTKYDKVTWNLEFIIGSKFQAKFFQNITTWMELGERFRAAQISFFCEIH